MISRREAVGGLAMLAPALGAMAEKKPEPKAPPVVVPMRVAENTPWTTIQAGSSKPYPFVVSLISNILHCDPSLTRELGAVQAGGSSYRVSNVVVGGALAVTEMGLIPYANYYATRVVAGTFEVGVFRIFHLEWDKPSMTVIYDPAATRKDYKPFERPPSDAAQFPTVYAEVNGRRVSLLINTVTPGGVVLRGTPENIAMAQAAPRHRRNLGRDGSHGGYTFVSEAVSFAPAEIAGAIVTVAPTPELPWVGESHGKPPAWVDGYVGFDIAKRMNLFVNHMAREFSGRANSVAGMIHMDDRAGLNLYARAGGYQIGEVDPKGPAARIGLRDGDWIIGCDLPRGLPGLPWGFTQPPGTAIQLEVQRNSGPTEHLTLVTEERL